MEEFNAISQIKPMMDQNLPFPSRKNRSFPFWGEVKFHHKLQHHIRNRPGHRPPHANRNGGDILIASYNVHKCVGQDNLFNPQRIIKVIEEINPQLLALQEVDRRFGTREGLLDLERLKERTGLVHVPLHSRRQHSHGFHGNALFCRQGRIHALYQIDLPGMEPRGAVIVEMTLPTGSLRVIAAHFGLLRRSRKRQVDSILDFLAKRPLMPTLMIGDLNEWRLGKNSSLTPFMPFFDIKMGTVPSFPARFPVLALDRVFAFPQHLIASVDIHDTPLARIASDHLPIKAWIDSKSMSLNTPLSMPSTQNETRPHTLAV